MFQSGNEYASGKVTLKRSYALSTTNAWPVTKEDCSLAKKSAAGAIWSGTAGPGSISFLSGITLALS